MLAQMLVQCRICQIWILISTTYMSKQPLEATKSDLFNHFIDGSDSFRFFFIPVPLRSSFQIILKVPSVLSALNFKSFD